MSLVILKFAVILKKIVIFSFVDEMAPENTEYTNMCLVQIYDENLINLFCMEINP